MRILFLNRKDALSRPGGDTVQFLKTSKYLNRLGHQVDFHFGGPPFPFEYDVFHIFNLQTAQESLNQARYIKQKHAGLIALSTIWFDWEEKTFLRHAFLYTNNPAIKLCKKISPSFAWFLYQEAKRFRAASFRTIAQELLDLTDIILPNSILEAQALLRNFKVNGKIEVIPNGVDLEDEILNPEPVPELPIKDYVLEVGTIGPHKNQINLALAVPEEIPLVFVGGIYCKSLYSQEFLKIIKSRKNTYYLGLIENREKLAWIYLNARVHALPSFRETPGLASLEAVFFGCNIVTSKCGAQEEYFGPEAEYCDPCDINSIRKAILRAWDRPHSDNLRNLIIQKYNWEVAAKKTEAAYQSILKVNRD
ncbi:MAG: glycosyltransferase [Coprothermobacterota bacterium]|nr:glycosyltransferase [Coprothermobacterota bacterium]